MENSNEFEKNPSEMGTMSPLLERAFLFLEDGNWLSADEYCERVLDLDPKNTQAYLGKLMAELKVSKQEDLKNCAKPFDASNNYQKVVRFGDEAVKATLAGYIKHINTRNENARVEDIYNRAKETMQNAHTESAFEKAAQQFGTIRGYKDAAALVEECREKAEFNRMESQKRNKKIAIAVGLSLCAIVALVVLWVNVIIPDGKYKDAVALMDAGKYSEAIVAFEALDDYKDSKNKINECKEAILLKQYTRATELQSVGKYDEAIAAFEALNGYKDSNDKINECKVANAFALMEAGKYDEVIAAFKAVYGLENSKEKLNECYYAWGNACFDSKDFKNAAIAFGRAGTYQDAKERSLALWETVAVRDVISAGWGHTVGLKKNGTVVAVGYNDDGRCDVSGWKDVVAIRAGHHHTVGLKADGTVVAVGSDYNGECDVSEWTNIIAISAGRFHTVGLKADGTVVAAGFEGSGKCDVSEWTNIVAISAGEDYTMGLKDDGTVVIAGDRPEGSVSDWTDLVAISAGRSYALGLKADGTVVTIGKNSYGRCNVWRYGNVAISAGVTHTVGLTDYGSVFAVGSTTGGKCDVEDWKEIGSPSH